MFTLFILTVIVLCAVGGAAAWVAKLLQKPWPRDAEIGFKACQPQERP